MLKTLRVKNIGLIEDLSVEFGKGLNILTGETGAGKSMILSALNLLLGERADYSDLKDKTKDGLAEGIINPENLIVPLLEFTEEGIEPEDGEFIIRRLLQKENKSRAIVNGSTIILASLKSAGEKVVDIHGQHDHQTLLKKESHLQWLDTFLDIANQTDEVAALNSAAKETQKELRALVEKQKEARSKAEFLEFKAAEIEKAALRDGEEEELDNEQKLLANAEKIRNSGEDFFSNLYDSEESIVVRLEEISKEMDRLKGIDQAFEKFAPVISEAAVQISEAAMEINSHCSGLESDHVKLKSVEERISLIEKLKRKYGASVPELIQIMEEARTELDSLDSADENRQKLEEQLESQKNELQKKAAELHKKRLKGIKAFKSSVERELSELNMGKARFEVEIKLDSGGPDEDYILDGNPCKMFPHGFGEFQFLISTNEGVKPKPLVKTASGGEISRVMLGLKCAAGKKQPVPILVFDEIDAGIGGKTADLVGEKLKKLSKNCQILCITHLPQIASKADSHYLVKKESLMGGTSVSITRLSDEERVEELARMQAGKEITDTARKHAREMIQK